MVGMIIIVPEDLLFGMKVCTKALKIIIMIQRISVKLYSLVRKGLYHHLLVWKKIKEDLEKYSYKGWDGREFLRWYDEFNEFLDAKQLRTVYPTVDDLCVAMGTVSYEHQGRENRIGQNE